MVSDCNYPPRKCSHSQTLDNGVRRGEFFTRIKNVWAYLHIRIPLRCPPCDVGGVSPKSLKGNGAEKSSVCCLWNSPLISSNGCDYGLILWKPYNTTAGPVCWYHITVKQVCVHLYDNKQLFVIIPNQRMRHVQQFVAYMRARCWAKGANMKEDKALFYHLWGVWATCQLQRCPQFEEIGFGLQLTALPIS